MQMNKKIQFWAEIDVVFDIDVYIVFGINIDIDIHQLDQKTRLKTNAMISSRVDSSAEIDSASNTSLL